jgi:tetratricopeptide (TPR) repeat protein
MITLRIQHRSSLDGSAQHVLIDLDGDGEVPVSAENGFDFALDQRDRDDLRWYLEDYLEYPVDPAPAIASRIESRIAQIGADLFRAVFPADSDARERVWAVVRDRLAEVRVEIITDVDNAARVPWELLRDPRTNTPVALRARSFVRSYRRAAQRPAAVTATTSIRILLVICRPGGSSDVPFRSVANQIVRLYPKAPKEFSLEVLRPATFAALGRRLRTAADRGEAYHVVHFDGHGSYEDRPDGGGKRGYLLFEDADAPGNVERIDGSRLGGMLAETGVPLLMLNACRSAHSDVAARPEDAANAIDDPHDRVRAYGSLAQEVMDAGVAGVVAMSYNVYVVTAAQFVAELYQNLLEGHDLGWSVSRSRKRLADDPGREIAFEDIPLQDWCVPVVFEVAPLQLFPPRKDGVRLPPIFGSTALDATTSELAATSLPPAPDFGFYGRDETLLAIERAFDQNPLVLLHAFAGSGKTSTVAEFARWYQLTGGLSDPTVGAGPVVFLSFEQHRTMATVLNDIFSAIQHVVGEGDRWLALSVAQRRAALLDLLGQLPALIVWDNVEPVNGFPEGAESAWSAEEIRELVDLLRDLGQTKAKVLLTSRRTEQMWLGGLPTRVALPPMTLPDRFRLARAIASRSGHRLAELAAWRPLLRFTDGNPLTVTVLVQQALRAGVTEQDAVATFVSQLEAGAAKITDEAEQGRGKSLGASLSYGFGTAFADGERHLLALLSLFQSWVTPTNLAQTAQAVRDGMKRAGLTAVIPETDLVAVEALLTRAGDIGLLSRTGPGFSLHPALPWYFQREFDAVFGDRDEPARKLVLRAFTMTLASFAEVADEQYRAGNANIIDWLSAEEANLISAHRTALHERWIDEGVMILRGIQVLYEHTGRDAELFRLVSETAPSLCDPDTDLPISEDLEGGWLVVIELLQRAARRRLDGQEAERLMRLSLEVSSRRAAAAQEIDPAKRTDVEHNHVRSLAVDLMNLGMILYEQRRRDCVPYFEQALGLCIENGDPMGAARCAANLANAYMGIRGIKDTAEAERLLVQATELYEGNPGRQGLCASQLAQVFLQRIEEAEPDTPIDELNRLLNEGIWWVNLAFERISPDSIRELAGTNQVAGRLIALTGNLDVALRHFNDGIKFDEQIGDPWGAASTRFFVALTLMGYGRLADAALYAERALQGWQELNQVAQATQATALLADIRERLAREKA